MRAITVPQQKFLYEILLTLLWVIVCKGTVMEKPNKVILCLCQHDIDKLHVEVCGPNTENQLPVANSVIVDIGAEVALRFTQYHERFLYYEISYNLEQPHTETKELLANTHLA